MNIPTLKLHATGQAYIRWQGKTKYFGKYGTPETDRAYRQWMQGLLGNKGDGAESPLVSDLIQAYVDANPSKNHGDKFRAIADLGPLSGHRCHEYTPLAYRKHRELVAGTGTRCARHVNDLMRLVQRIFRWGVSMEMCSLDTYSRLKTVDPLKAHEVKRQSKKRLPAKREDVEKTLAELHDVPAAIVRLILYTGARPGEICTMKASEVTKSGPQGTWVYRPGKHKTGHHGKRRFIAFGPLGKEILRQFWPACGDYFFPSAVIISHYRPASLRQAIGHACIRAGVPYWSPYQLRHLRLTELAVDKGLETAASVAGHGEIETTKLYQHEPDVLQLNRAV